MLFRSGTFTSQRAIAALALAGRAPELAVPPGGWRGATVGIVVPAQAPKMSGAPWGHPGCPHQNAMTTSAVNVGTAAAW